MPTDVARHKKTLPVLYAFEHAGPVDRERLTALYALAEPAEDDVLEIVAILDRAGAQGLHARRGAALARHLPRRTGRARGGRQRRP